MNHTAWSPHLSIGVPAIDNAHKEFLETLTDLTTAPEHEFGARFFGLVSRLEQDFRSEEKLMEEADFSGLVSHREQHARVLSALHRVLPLVMDGNLALGREAVQLLSQWFVYHLSTMDTAFALSMDLAKMQSTSSAAAA